MTDAGSSALSLQIAQRHMLEPGDDDGDVALVKAVINGTDPALGVSLRRQRDSVVVTLSGTVAGFFTALRIQWNPESRTGTGRVAGELSVHPRVQVSETACPPAQR